MFFINFNTVHAAVLSKIPNSQIGATVTTIKGSSSSLLDAVVETTIAINNSGALKTATNAAALTIPLIAKRAIPILGAASSLGYLADCVFDLPKAYDNKWLDDYPLLKSIVESTFPPNPTVTESCYDGQNVACPSKFGSYCIDGKNMHLVFVNTYIDGSGSQSGAQSVINNSPSYSGDEITYSYGPIYYANEGYRFHRDRYKVTWTTDPISNSGKPVTLNESQAQTLANAIVNAFTTNPAVKNAIDSLAKAHPDVVTTPSPITNQDINNWATTNNYNTNQTYIDYLTNLKNNYEGDTTWIDQEIAKAQAEQEKEQTEDVEDTFDPITTSAFDPAYNPGDFDIPARFTQFLQNVKTSGLFSFSSAFFDSLPGGGSPVYTVDAGNYGTHTIDLSDTMSTGLAVLKSILLACFGFLSIRAVIMKR